MESEGLPAGRFSVTVPGRPGLVGTLRVFAAAVARHYGLADEVVEDVKLAVSEACTDPVAAGAGGDLSLEMRVEGEALLCRVTSPVWAPHGLPAVELPDDVEAGAFDRMQLVRALFDDAERAERDGLVEIRFSTRSRAGGD